MAAVARLGRDAMGEVINLFMDYETLHEHLNRTQASSQIFNSCALPKAILAKGSLEFLPR